MTHLPAQRCTPWHLTPADATNVSFLLYGLFSIGWDDETTRVNWDRAVEQYEAVSPDHTEIALAVQVGCWCADHKPLSKMDLAVMKRVNSLLRSAAVDPSIPADLRKQAAAFSTTK